MLTARLLIVLPLTSLLGFLLPGYFLARLLQSRERICTGFVLSILVLYNGVLLFHFAGLPIRFETVLCYLLSVTVILGLLARRRQSAATAGLAAEPEISGALQLRFVLPCVLAIAALMFLRCTVQPLAGYDATIRWDLLARQLLAHEHLDFYPPLTAADFHYYALPDAIASVVSVCYWWIYAAAGAHIPAATAFFIVAQWLSIVLLTYRLANAAGGRTAGLVSVSILAATPLLFRSVAIGQETGLTALSVVAVFHALTKPAGIRQAILAGLVAAPGVLAREYGWVIVACGLAAMHFQRQERRVILSFLSVAGAIAAPWYLYNWMRMGNPIYPTRIGDLLPVNEVYSAIIESYREHHSILRTGPALWYSLLSYLVRQAPIQTLAGSIAFVLGCRRQAHLAFTILVFGCLWLWSIGYTMGGAHYAARVLTPSLVALSIMSAPLLSRMLERTSPRVAVKLGFGLCLGWALLNAVTHPLEPRRATSPAAWARIATEPLEFVYRESRLPEMVGRHLPAGSRVLTDSAYAHAALIGSQLEGVIVWSPEVSFLFEDGVDEAAARRKLKEAGITAVYWTNAGAASRYLNPLSFFKRLAVEPAVQSHPTQFGTLYVLDD